MINNVVLVGRLVRQPELITTQEGKIVTNVTLAVARPFKNTVTGEYDTDFINISMWENLAKHVVEYCGKGSIIGVRGRLTHRTLDVPNYKSLRVVEVVADKVSFIQTRLEKESIEVEDTELLLEELS